MKKLIIASVFSGILLLSQTFAAEEKTVQDLVKQYNTVGIVAQDIDFNNEVSREEFFSMIAFLMGADNELKISGEFEDISEVSKEYEGYIAYLINSGVINGVIREGKVYIDPKIEITKQEASIIIAKALGVYSTVPNDFIDADSVATWASDYVSAVVNSGIVTLEKTGEFNPYKNISIGETMDILANLIEKDYFNKDKVLLYSGNGVATLADGSLSEASFYSPTDIIKYKKAFYITDTKNNVIRQIKDGVVSTIAGSIGVRDEFGKNIGSFEDGKNAKFDGPAFMAVPDTGILISDKGNNLIRYFYGNKVSTYAGNIEGGYKDGKRTKALFLNPTGIVATEKGVIYIADTGNNVIRKIDRNDNVTTYAGVQSIDGGYKDGDAKKALFNRPMGLALKDGVLYVADSGNQRIRKIENGKVSTVAGIGTETYDDSTEIIGDYIDGTVENAAFNFPQNIELDNEGNIYVADTGNSAIRKIDTEGNVYTLVGLSNDELVKLEQPVGLMIDDNKLYVTDTVKNNIVVISID